MVISETARRPYFYRDFHRQWREIATAAGVPAGVWNMDSRAGGITEGDEAGAEVFDLQSHATHDDVATTNIYRRKRLGASRRVAAKRVAARGKGDG